MYAQSGGINDRRCAKRTGNGSVPLLDPEYGLAQWEVTMPEMLAKAGYVSGMFGKWHLGHNGGRLPTDAGFDEWYGTPKLNRRKPLA